MKSFRGQLDVARIVGELQRFRDESEERLKRVEARRRQGVAVGLTALAFLAASSLMMARVNTGAQPENTPTPAVTTIALAPAAAERQQPISRGLPADASPARSARTIVVDPGHGGPETGAVRETDKGTTLKEKDLTLKVALAAAEFLRDAGQRVILTRTGDQAVNADGRDLTDDGSVTVSDDLQARIDLANAARADLFVSIHFNAGKDGVRGTEVFYNADRPHSEQSRRLAAAIYIRLIESIKATGYDAVERGVKKDSQATGGPPFFLLGPTGGNIVRASEMPAALGEGLYVSHPAEAELLQNDAFLLDMARAYAHGVLDYLDGKK